MTDVTTRLEKLGLKTHDGFWAIGLLLVLGLVFAYDRGRTSKVVEVVPQAAPTVTKTEKTIQTPDVVIQPLRLAVTTFKPLYDDMGTLLDTLGPGYRGYKTLDMNELLDKKSYKDIDVMFVTCSPVPADWLEAAEIGAEARPGTISSRPKPEIVDRLKDNLREFVGQGGTLYASDWQFSLIAFAFREFIDPERANEGAVQTVTANAEDESLRKIIGDRLELRFDLGAWKPAAFYEKKVSVLLRGDYQTTTGRTRNAPLLVKFPFERGTVIFTSFHNEKQNSELETKLLKYLVFTTILAKTEAKMTETLVQGGFKQAGRSLLSVSSGVPSITETYQCTKAGPIRFSLGFENRDAQMKLTVIGPDGVSHEQEGISPLVVDIPNGAVGDWKYTITALKTPFDNFPYALSIGQK
jgi:hypothetical protein